MIGLKTTCGVPGFADGVPHSASFRSEEGSKDLEVGPTDLREPSKREGHSQHLRDHLRCVKTCEKNESAYRMERTDVSDAVRNGKLGTGGLTRLAMSFTSKQIAVPPGGSEPKCPGKQKSVSIKAAENIAKQMNSCIEK